MHPCALGVLLALALGPRVALAAPPERVVGIVANTHGTCAWSVAGHAYCWGSALVQDTTISTDAPQPARIAGLEDVTQVGMGEAHVCALLRDRSVRCWGWNDGDMLGTGKRGRQDGFARVALADVTQLAVGPRHACARRGDGSVWCWGGNAVGELGVRGSNPLWRVVRVPGVTQAVEVGVGFDHSCARLANGAVTCWGANRFGQTHLKVDEVAAPRRVPGITDAVELAISGQHSCARLRDDRVRCWGMNAEGEAEITRALGPVASVVNGGPNTCVRKLDGTVQCWGEVAWIADGARGLRGVDRLAVSSLHACALIDGDVWCWGDDRGGQLGDGVVTPAFRSGPMPEMREVRAVHTRSIGPCALLRDGSVRCWGGWTSRFLPDHASAPQPPVAIAGVSDGIALTVGEAAGCVLTREHKVRCWGSGSFTSQGRSIDLEHTTAVEIPGWSAIEEVGVGRDALCARRSNGTVDCMGVLSGGVQDLADIRALAVGFGFACVLQRDGTVRCWGNYSDAWPSRVMPPVVDGLGGATHLSCGATDACASGRDGRVWCWRMSDDPDKRTRPFTAKVVEGVDSAIDVAVGIGHACALRADGTARCWGTSESDVLAPGAASADAVVDPGITGATQVTAGSRHSCARLKDGGVECWGQNAFGELGLPMQLGEPPSVPRRVAWP